MGPVFLTFHIHLLLEVLYKRPLSSKREVLLCLKELCFIKACSAGRLGSMTGFPRYVPCILLWAKQYIVKNSCVWVYAILSRAQILYASTTTSLFWALLMCAVPFAADFNGSLKSHPGDA